MVCCWTSFHRVRGGRSTDRCLRGLTDWVCNEDGWDSQTFIDGSSCAAAGVTQVLATWLDDGTKLAALWLDGVVADCLLDVYIRRTTNTISSHAINTRWRSISWKHTQQNYSVCISTEYVLTPFSHLTKKFFICLGMVHCRSTDPIVFNTLTLRN